MDESRYTNAILKDIRNQVQAVLEIVADNQKKLENIPKREEFNDLKADISTIKRAITDTNHEARLLERRITKVEGKV